GNITPGTGGLVIAGPSCIQNQLISWEIRLSDGVIGWVTEIAAGSNDYLLSSTGSTLSTVDCPGTPPSQIKLGMRVTVHNTEPFSNSGGLNVFSQPLFGEIVTAISDGTIAQVIDGPVCQSSPENKFIAWKLLLDNNMTGWVPEIIVFDSYSRG